MHVQELSEAGGDPRIDRIPPLHTVRQHCTLRAFVTMNWRAKPLVSYRVIVDLIGSTTTETELTVRCESDEKAYIKGIVVSDAEMAEINIVRDDFHGEWNYTIRPRN